MRRQRKTCGWETGAKEYQTYTISKLEIGWTRKFEGNITGCNNSWNTWDMFYISKKTREYWKDERN